MDKEYTAKIKSSRGKTPVFIAEPHSNSQVRFWCPYCIKYHLHGIVSQEIKGEGHRSSDCPIGNFKTGYYLITQERANRINGFYKGPSLK